MVTPYSKLNGIGREDRRGRSPLRPVVYRIIVIRGSFKQTPGRRGLRPLQKMRWSRYVFIGNRVIH